MWVYRVSLNKYVSSHFWLWLLTMIIMAPSQSWDGAIDINAYACMTLFLHLQCAQTCICVRETAREKRMQRKYMWQQSLWYVQVQLHLINHTRALKHPDILKETTPTTKKNCYLIKLNFKSIISQTFTQKFCRFSEEKNCEHYWHQEWRVRMFEKMFLMVVWPLKLSLSSHL